jgi:hypothetical protein
MYINFQFLQLPSAQALHFCQVFLIADKKLSVFAFCHKRVAFTRSNMYALIHTYTHPLIHRSASELLADAIVFKIDDTPKRVSA